MAEYKKQKIVCPKCKKELILKVWDVVELPYDEEQRKQVLQNSLFKVNCDDCNIAFPVAYKCQYNDMERKFLIWVAPKVNLEGSKENVEIAKYNEQLKSDNRLRLAQGGYRYRIVRTDNDLREKVIIFEEGLDDRYIETLKMVYVPLIKKELKEDSKIIGIYFDKKKDGSYRLVAIIDNMPPLFADIDMNIYEDMKVKLKNIVESKTPEGLGLIDAKWALDIMTSQVENT